MQGSAGGLTAGARFDRFTIEDQLGAGGMGRVYRAHDPALNRADRASASSVLLPALPISAMSPEEALPRAIAAAERAGDRRQVMRSSAASEGRRCRGFSSHLVTIPLRI